MEIEDEAGEGGEKSEVSYSQSFVQESGAQVGQVGRFLLICTTRIVIELRSSVSLCIL